MIKNLEEQKRVMKEKMNNEIERYFEKFGRSSEAESFDISEIEKLMTENRENTKELFNQATGGLTSAVEVDDKKNALIAEAHFVE